LPAVTGVIAEADAGADTTRAHRDAGRRATAR
jgi:hypothetical protein